MARISIMHGWYWSAFPDGTEFGGIGITPDQRVEVTVADVLAGKDAALDRARAYLAGRR